VVAAPARGSKQKIPHPSWCGGGAGSYYYAPAERIENTIARDALCRLCAN
jgi:hypothetical protein